MKRNAQTIVVGLAAAFIACATQAAPRYTAVPLGTLGGKASFGYGINDAGQVTGRSFTTGDDVTHPFIHENGRMTDIGSLGGEFVEARAINNSGQVVGSDSKGARTPNPTLRAFLYSKGSMTDIGAIVDEKTYSAAYGINDNGEVTGGASGGTWSGNAWIYKSSVVTDIGALGRTGSVGNSINNRGQVTGDSTTADGLRQHAFLYTAGTMVDLGALPNGKFSHGYAINDAGQVAGTSDIETYATYFPGLPPPTHHAFRYSNGALSDLGTLGGSNSDGFGINAGGDVVGMADVATGAVAMLYTDGKMYDLNTLVESGLAGGTLLYARGINAKGQIVANGCAGAMCQAYRLDPVREDGGGGGCAFVSAIPTAPIDPTLPAALLVAAAMLVSSSGRRKHAV